MGTSSKGFEERQDSIKKLGDLIKGIRVAMLTTLDPDGVLRSRPMATQETDFDGDLWFFTRRDSGKVHAIENDQHVNVAFASIEDQRYVSASGRARIVSSQDKIKELWSPILRAWFPQGVDDPDITLICVGVESAEYWDAPSGKLVQLAGFAKAALTGKPYDQNNQSHRLDLQ